MHVSTPSGAATSSWDLLGEDNKEGIEDDVAVDYIQNLDLWLNVESQIQDAGSKGGSRLVCLLNNSEAIVPSLHWELERLGFERGGFVQPKVLGVVLSSMCFVNSHPPPPILTVESSSSPSAHKFTKLWMDSAQEDGLLEIALLVFEPSGLILISEEILKSPWAHL